MVYTRCPQCKTVFEATTTDLEAHEGLVRCGECDEIFHILDNEMDASQIEKQGGVFTDTISQMLDESEAVASETDEPEEGKEDLDAEEAEESPAHEETPEAEPLEHIEPEDAPLEVEYRHISELDPDPSIYRRKLQSREDVGTEISEVESFDDAGDDVIVSDDIDLREESLPPAPVTAGFTMVNGELDLPEPEPDVTEIASSRAKRQRLGASTLGWGAGSLLLLCILAIQWGVHSSAVRTNPEFRPFLEKACAIFSCKGVLARDANLVKIVSSDRVDSTDGSFRLLASIRNTASFPTTLPDLEVSLNNPFDMMIGRRTFSPEQYLKQKPADDTLIKPGQIVEIELPFLAMNKTVSGYELHLRRAK